MGTIYNGKLFSHMQCLVGAPIPIIHKAGPLLNFTVKCAMRGTYLLFFIDCRNEGEHLCHAHEPGLYSGPTSGSANEILSNNYISPKIYVCEDDKFQHTLNILRKLTWHYDSDSVTIGFRVALNHLQIVIISRPILDWNKPLQ